jgi:hypothetical protein
MSRYLFFDQNCLYFTRYTSHILLPAIYFSTKIVSISPAIRLTYYYPLFIFRPKLSLFHPLYVSHIITRYLFLDQNCLYFTRYTSHILLPAIYFLQKKTQRVKKYKGLKMFLFYYNFFIIYNGFRKKQM